MALFGSTAETSKLIRFKAGRMTLRDKTVTADTRKGLLFMEYSPDRILLLKWSDRTKGQGELDLKLFPGEAEFCHVPQCTTGRVYILRFKGTPRKYFFWMQESNEKGDEALVTKMNSLLSSPAPPASAGGASGMGGLGGLGALGGLGGLGGLSGERMQNMLAGMDPQQLSQLLSLGGGGGGGAGHFADMLGRLSGRGGSASSTGSSASASSSAAGGGPTQLPPLGMTSQLSNVNGPGAPVPSSDALPTIMAAERPPSVSMTSATRSTTASGDAAPAPASAGAAAGAGAGAASSRLRLEDLQSFFTTMPAGASESSAKQDVLELGDVVTTERLLAIIALPEVREQLAPLLPEDGSDPTFENLQSIVASPQFAASLKVFNAALESGMLAPFMTAFQVSDAAKQCAAAGDVEGFLRALQASDSSTTSKDEVMDVD